MMPQARRDTALPINARTKHEFAHRDLQANTHPAHERGCRYDLLASRSLPLKYHRRVVLSGAHDQARPRRQSKIAIADLDGRMGLAAELPDCLDCLCHASAIGRMIVA